MTTRRLLVALAVAPALAALAAACRSSTGAPGPALDDGASRVLVWHDRSGQPLRTVAGSSAAYEHLWFEADESAVLATIRGDEGVWRVNLATGTRRPAPEVRSAATPEGRLSSRGQWIVYVSREAGLPEIYVATHPDRESRWLVSLPRGGVHPVWRADDRQLYYWAPGGRLMVASLEVGRTLVLPSMPELVFENEALAGAPFAVTRDASRVLIAAPADSLPR